MRRRKTNQQPPTNPKKHNTDPVVTEEELNDTEVVVVVVCTRMFLNPYTETEDKVGVDKREEETCLSGYQKKTHLSYDSAHGDGEDPFLNLAHSMIGLRR